MGDPDLERTHGEGDIAGVYGLRRGLCGVCGLRGLLWRNALDDSEGFTEVVI